MGLRTGRSCAWISIAENEPCPNSRASRFACCQQLSPVLSHPLISSHLMDPMDHELEHRPSRRGQKCQEWWAARGSAASCVPRVPAHAPRQAQNSGVYQQQADEYHPEGGPVRARAIAFPLTCDVPRAACTRRTQDSQRRVTPRRATATRATATRATARRSPTEPQRTRRRARRRRRTSRSRSRRAHGERARALWPGPDGTR